MNGFYVRAGTISLIVDLADSIAASNSAAAASCIPGSKWLYVSRVITTEECPKISATAFGLMPCSRYKLAIVCRQSCRRTPYPRFAITSRPKSWMRSRAPWASVAEMATLSIPAASIISSCSMISGPLPVSDPASASCRRYGSTASPPVER